MTQFLNITASERPRPAPRICPCENGGQCEDVGPDNKLICNCLPGFSGETCEVYAELSLGKGGAGYSILLAILTCFIVAGLIGAAWFIVKKKPL